MTFAIKLDAVHLSRNVQIENFHLMLLWSNISINFRAVSFTVGTLQRTFHQGIYNDTCIFSKHLLVI